MIIADAFATIIQAIGAVIAAWTLLVAAAAVRLARICRTAPLVLDTPRPALLPQWAGDADDTELIPRVPTTQPIPLREAH